MFEIEILLIAQHESCKLCKIMALKVLDMLGLAKQGIRKAIGFMSVQNTFRPITKDIRERNSFSNTFGASGTQGAA